MKNKVAAALIMGDSFNEDEVKVLFKSLEDAGIAGIYVNFNGKNKVNLQSWTTIPVTVKKFKWEEDFSKARQQSFDMVPKDEFDWIVWLDTDDALRVDKEGGLDAMFDSLDEYTRGIFVRYDYAVDPETGTVIVEQWRERFMSTKTKWTWRYRIHEVCGTPPGTQFARRDHVHIEHLRKNGEDRGARDRNRKIIATALREEPDEPRYLYYFASETMAEAAEKQGQEKTELIDAAIHAFMAYRDMIDDVTDDYYIATSRIGELYYMKQDYVTAIDAHLECIAIYPTWPDAYVGAAKCCMEIGDWGRMKGFADMASKCPKPITPAGIEPFMSSFYPYFLRGLAEMELGEYEDAIVDLSIAESYWDANGQIQEKIDEILVLQNANKDDDIDVRKQTRGTRPEKSICFFTASLPFTWHPNVEAGAGAERCIMQLAPRFAADGWRVSVFGTPGEHRGIADGVEWWDSAEYNPDEPFTVFISSRSPIPFQANINAKAKLLWMHDVNIGESLNQIKDIPDKILGLTNWHANHLARLYGLRQDQLGIVPNGIELDRFQIDRSNDTSNEPKFIWSSSPDRGLDNLLGLWPLIREAYPDATLDIFYGWEIMDKVIAQYKARGMHNTGGEIFKEDIFKHLEWLGGEEAGIFNNGRVDQKSLAEAMYQSNYWPYTTGFMETFCITAIECQAAGVIPVTSNLAALQEVLAIPSNAITGWPMNRDYQVRWMNMLQKYNEDVNLRLEQREKGREKALTYTWDNAYKIWNEIFMELGVTVI